MKATIITSLIISLGLSSASEFSQSATETNYLEPVNAQFNDYAPTNVSGISKDAQEERVISFEKIHVQNKPLTAPFTINVEDWNETLVFATCLSWSPSIVSFDTATKVFKDLSGKFSGLPEDEEPMHMLPKISSDGKQIAFFKSNRSVIANTSNIYLMNSDGSNVRKIVESKSFQNFAFGPDDKSLLFVDPNYNLKQVFLNGEEGEGSIKEIENHQHDWRIIKKVVNIAYANGYVYWQTDSRRGFEIWRKNLLIDSAGLRELVYQSNNFYADFLISPDGEKLLVLQSDRSNRIVWSIFALGCNCSPLVDEPVFSNHHKRLFHMFWHTDAQGQDWIYAEDWSGDSKGLIRCKVEEVPELNFEMVIPGFSSYSGVSIVPKMNV